MHEDTPSYNLKAVVKETGLTPATLRAWERRYGLLKPQRSPGGHRLYTYNEVEMLKWLVKRQEEGLSISQAVEMWRRGGLAMKMPSQATPVHATGESVPILERLRDAWVSACSSFDERGAEQALSEAFSLVTPEAVLAEILQKGLAEIGNGWYSGVISVQQEHFASALAMRRLHTLFAALPQPTRSGRILAACPVGEQHVFALLMLSYLLRRRGWDVVYLGANVPLIQLDAAIQHISPQLILSSAETLINAAALREMGNFGIGQGVPMAYGGGIFTYLPALRESIPGFYLGDSFEGVTQRVESQLTRPVPLPRQMSLSEPYKALLADFLASELLIVGGVRETLKSAPIEPAHLDEANNHFPHDIAAALRLGNIEFLDYSADWLEGLLENYGLPPRAAKLYYQAYRQAVQQHLGPRVAPLANWLEQAALNLVG